MTANELRVPFNMPALNLREQIGAIEKSLFELLNNGPFLNGPYLENFENTFADYLSADRCFGVSSGTAALEIAFKALELGEGSEILVAGNSGGYATLALLNSNLRPRFYDVDRNGLIDFSKLESSLSDRTRALVVTHLYGQVCDMSVLIDFCHSNNLFLIEDCAQSLGAYFEGLPLGSFGDLSCFSFYPTKNLASIGDAGAVATKNTEFASRIESLRQYGWGVRYSIERSGGSNYRMDEIHALCVSTGFQNLATQTVKRNSIWSRYNKILLEFGSGLLTGKAGMGAPHLAVLRVSNRDDFMSFFSENFVDTAIHYPIADFNQPALKGLFDFNFSTWETTKFCDQVVSIPLFPSMSDFMVARVEETLQEYFRNNHFDLR